MTVRWLGRALMLAAALLRGKPVVVHGDGESLWTLTHARDFARPFARLLGEPRALGEAFHLTGDRAWSWNEIFLAVAAALGVEAPEWVHVASDTLVRYHPAWEGPLLGDKSPSVLFDNRKVKAVVGDFDCPIDPWEAAKAGLCAVGAATRSHVSPPTLPMRPLHPCSPFRIQSVRAVEVRTVDGEP